MTLTDYVLQVLVEENPYTECMIVADRPIMYEDAAVLIASDIVSSDVTSPVSDIVKDWLHHEFGKDISREALMRSINRIQQMTVNADGAINIGGLQ